MTVAVNGLPGPILEPSHDTPGHRTAICSASPGSLQQAASYLHDGEVVAIPTETVYGLAANALSPVGVSKIFTTKGRPQDNPLIIHISSYRMLADLYPEGFVMPQVYCQAVKRYWPGPLTILLPKSPLVPDGVTCGQPTMAVRMPLHPVARELIDICGFPLAAPSANSSSRPSPTRAEHVLEDLQGKIPLVLDGGECKSGIESTVLDGLRHPPAILRPGGVTWEQLRELPGLEDVRVYQKDFTDARLEAVPTTPGMKYRHYSPHAPVILLQPAGQEPSGSSWEQQVMTTMMQEIDDLWGQGSRKVGVLVMVPPGTLTSTGLQERGCVPKTDALTPGTPQPGSIAWLTSVGCLRSEVVVYVLGERGDHDQVAHNLFDALRVLDGQGVDAMIVEGVDQEGQGLAIMNRLTKAASRVVRV